MSPPPTIEPNVGLFDGRGIAETLYSLDGRFRAVEFADWCSLAEEIVLRDSILVSGKIDRFPRHLRLTLAPYLESGIFRPLVAVYDRVDLPHDYERIAATQQAIADGLTGASVTDANHEVARLLGAERYTCIPATPLLRNLQHFGLVQRPRIENAVWDLAAQYSTLSEAALQCRREAQELASLPAISVPPIALIALQRSRHFDQILYELLQLRDDFSSLRATLRALQEQLTSGRLAPGKVRDLQETWRARWQALASKLGATTSIMSMARTAAPMLKDGGRLIASTYKGEPLGAADGALNLLAQGVASLGSLKLRPVHRPVSNYLRTTDQHMLAAIARNFEHDFILIDRDMRLLADHPANPWHRAIAARSPTRYARTA